MITFEDAWGDSITIGKSLRGNSLVITTKDEGCDAIVSIAISFADFNSLAEKVRLLEREVAAND